MINICGGGRKGKHTREDCTSMKRARTRERRDRTRTGRKMPQMAAAHDHQPGIPSSYQPTVEDRQQTRGGKYPLISPHERSTTTHQPPRSYLPHLDVITLNPYPVSSLLRPCAYIRRRIFLGSLCSLAFVASSSP